MPFLPHTYGACVTRMSFTAQINRTAVTGVSLSMLKLTEPIILMDVSNRKHKNNINVISCNQIYTIEEKQCISL